MLFMAADGVPASREPQKESRMFRFTCCQTFLRSMLASLVATIALAGAAHAQSGLGACCLPTGACISNAASTQCQSLGGTFLDGQACSACDQAGACCRGSVCTTTNPAQCAAIQAQYFGGTCQPSPCPSTTVPGVCCNPVTGGCFSGPATQCAAPAIWYASPITCNPFPCGNLGACCNVGGGCTQTVQAGCNGTWTANSPCPVTAPCSPAGVCCITATGACISSSAANCPTTAGTFFPGATCSTIPCQPHGACCYLNPSTNSYQCIATVKAECASLGGTFLANTPCTPNPCPQVPRGACCIPGVAGNCAFILQTQCPTGSPFFPGQTCTPNPCPNSHGACCTATAGCIVVAAGQCPTTSLYIANTPCVPNPCPVLGACCTAAAGCVYTSLTNCPGQYFPNTTCNPTPCNVTGACCTIDGICSATVATQCSGQWTASTPCTPNPCPRGGCCNPDNGLCVIATQAQCHAHNLLWLGSGVPCTPNNCVPRRGACCVTGSAICTITTASNCTGTWHANHPCAPNPCCPPNYTGSGVLGIGDIFDFLSAWFAGCP